MCWGCCIQMNMVQVKERKASPKKVAYKEKSCKTCNSFLQKSRNQRHDFPLKCFCAITIKALLEIKV